MISINPQKIFDFLFIVASSFIVAMAGNYFFQWDLQLGLMAGMILGAWSTLYDLGVHIAATLEGEELDGESEEGPKKL